ncbi:YaiI/YqxD family protein [Bartonella tamiae]|uniref:UPF0178 protein ME5_00326 n=1 Tax=Bartonella tamiae Th239 TaxID=1094558 RepID=J0R5P0_9HYPH|nr:YaiI/YqxD family protein [Bartonella tamiae]EJF90994.1 hypothetical protein ME5_00326 [Bartonella tamiae Th239]EJF93341.1 hypothetical protein MEG_01555 [Bartonella tamiae Th307]
MINKQPITLFIDADACPVKAEVYRVAERYGLKTYVVSNSFIKVPREKFVHAVIVAKGQDGADNWIVEHAQEASIVVTNDVPLAERIVKKDAIALSPTGRLFDISSIGHALATRNLMENLREGGMITGGPKPFSPRDRSNFLSALDLAVQRLKRRGYPIDEVSKNS